MQSRAARASDRRPMLRLALGEVVRGRAGRQGERRNRGSPWRFAKRVDAARSEQSLRVSTTIALTEAGTLDVQSRLVALGRVILDAEKLNSAGLMPPSRATPRQRTPITTMTHAPFVRKVNDLLTIMSMRCRLRGNHATSHAKRTERASLRRRDRLESPGTPCLEANTKKAGMLAALHFLTVAKKPQSSEKAC